MKQYLGAQRCLCTVEGRNPAPLEVDIDSSSHYLKGLFTSQVVGLGISEPSTVSSISGPFPTQALLTTSFLSLDDLRVWMLRRGSGPFSKKRPRNPDQKGVYNKIGMPNCGGRKQCKCMVSLGDFPYNSALFGLVV